MKQGSDKARGILAMVAACTIWGLSPLYYKLLVDVPPLEVLAHRTLWSAVFFGSVLAARGRSRAVVRHLVSWRGLGGAALAGLMISVNWFLFIFSIQIGEATQASLGYYIFPLVAVTLGLVVFGERLNVLKWIAIGLAAAAVVLLTWGLGAVPWLALSLAASFGAYGLIKKRLDLDPLVSVTAEVLVLSPLALIWLWGVHDAGWTGIVGRNDAVFGHDLRASLLLMASGPITAGPLILFSYATRRVAMTTIGLVQYLNPTLQFLVATLAFREPFGAWRAIAFGLIWVGLALYSAESLRQGRAARRASIAAAGVSTTVG